MRIGGDGVSTLRTTTCVRDLREMEVADSSPAQPGGTNLKSPM